MARRRIEVGALSFFFGICFALPMAWFTVSQVSADGAEDQDKKGTATEGRKVALPLRDPPPPVVKLTPPIRAAIRDYLATDDENRQRRGFLALKRAGIEGLPQVRYWLRRIRYESDVIESLVNAMLRAHYGDDFVPPIETSDQRVGDFFRKKLVRAQELARFGSYREALQISEALLALDKESPLAWELRRVLRESRERVLAEKLEPRLDASELIYEVGDEISLTLRLINRTKKKCEIKLDRGYLGQLVLDIDRRTIDGNASADQRLVTVRAKASLTSIELEPGEVWEQPIVVPGLEKEFSISGMVGRISLTGRFRPKGWGFAQENDAGNEPIAIRDTEFWIVPPAQKKGLESPLDRLIGAMFFNRAEDFLVGGQLAVWAGRSDADLNERLVDFLIEQIGELKGARFRLARNFLFESTGERFKSSEEWKEWWAKLREKTEIPAEGKIREIESGFGTRPKSTPPGK